MDDVKTLKTPPSFLGEMKGGLHGSSKASRPFLDYAMDSMRDLLEV
jgi:hypothetical protein